MDNEVTNRFTDIVDENAGNRPTSVIYKETVEAKQRQNQMELASLYYDQWIDQEMWKEFSEELPL